MHKIAVITGLFTIGCLATAYFYGWLAIVICLIGLVLIAALLRAFDGPTARR